MAPYQSFKLFLVDLIGLSKTGFHFVLGFLVYLVLAKAFNLKFSSAKTLIAPLVFALILEMMDFRDAIAYGHQPNLPDSVYDIIVTLSLPVAFWVVARTDSRKK